MPRQRGGLFGQGAQTDDVSGSDHQALNTTASEEGDPVIWCVFKTEFIAHLQQQTNGGIQVIIRPAIEYAKKKDKKAIIKFTKDESVQRNDVYKSHEVRVPSGEPPNSVSWPPAKRKPGAVRPVTNGKLLRPGGPSQSNNTVGELLSVDTHALTLQWYEP